MITCSSLFVFSRFLHRNMSSSYRCFFYVFQSPHRRNRQNNSAAGRWTDLDDKGLFEVVKKIGKRNMSECSYLEA